MNVGQALAKAQEARERAGDGQGRLAAAWLLSAVLHVGRLDLHLARERTLSPEQCQAFEVAVARRMTGEPLQYISGQAPFRYLTLSVGPGVLIPRPETEVLVDEFLKLLPPVAGTERLVADLGCGSGAIACALARERRDFRVLALDRSPEALEMTRRNVERLGLGDRITVVAGDIGARESFPAASLDGIVSNPPYVPSSLWEQLPREVRDFEPRLALDGGNDGLDVYRSLLALALTALKPGGALAVELFEESLDEAKALACAAGFYDVAIHLAS